LTNVSGTLFFSVDDGVFGRGLWKSDGSEGGTVLVKDIFPGGSSLPEALTNVSGTLLFTADDGVHARELWKSDGTGVGTVLVKDIEPGGGGLSSNPRFLTTVNRVLFSTPLTYR
jgi:ELWxxDGT repeat protein